jgi:molybdopterin/thiamine biosynthesis adenylyltransferase
VQRTDRQTAIAGWNQEALERACVAVYGRGWNGVWTVLGLSSMGIGTIIWMGSAAGAAWRVCEWIRTHLRSPSTKIRHYPLAVEYGAELDWVCGGSTIDVMVIATDEPSPADCCWAYANARGVRCVQGTTAGGGVTADRPLPLPGHHVEHPVTALAVAANLVDYVRETIAPLEATVNLPTGRLAIDPPPITTSGSMLLAGAGGIGVWTVAGLAAAATEACQLHVIDSDFVEMSNLNRQALYTSTDAHARRPKAPTVAAVLKSWFPGIYARGYVLRIGPRFAAALARQDRRPVAILSALDNAQGRLALQHCGRLLDVPVIQGGTSTFSADCITQQPAGPSLDEQLHGALASAARREEVRDRQGGCAVDASYCAPSMMAGSLVAYRAIQACQTHDALKPIRWRSGGLPVEEREQHDFNLDSIAL